MTDDHAAASHVHRASGADVFVEYPACSVEGEHSRNRVPKFVDGEHVSVQRKTVHPVDAVNSLERRTPGKGAGAPDPNFPAVVAHDQKTIVCLNRLAKASPEDAWLETKALRPNSREQSPEDRAVARVAGYAHKQHRRIQRKVRAEFTVVRLIVAPRVNLAHVVPRVAGTVKRPSQARMIKVLWRGTRR